MASTISYAPDMRSMRATAPTSTGTQDYTVSGFGTPQAAMVVHISGTSNSAAGADIVYSIGFWARYDGTDYQRVSHMAMEDNASGTPINSQSGNDDDAVIKNWDPDQDSNSVHFEASFDSVITNGIRLNWTTVDGTDTGYVIVTLFKGFDWAYLWSQEDASPYTQDIAYTGGPGTPDVLIGITTRSGDDDSAPGDIARLSFGFCVNDGSRTQGSVDTWYSFEGKSALGSVATHRGTASFLAHTKGKAGSDPSSPSWQRSVKSFDANGFTLQQDVTTGLEGRNSMMSVLGLKLPSGCPKAVKHLTAPTSTGSWAITGVGFQPQMCIMGITGVLDSGSVIITPRGNVWGTSAINATEQFCQVAWQEDGATTRVCKTQSSSTAIDHPSWDGTGAAESDFVAGFTSFDSDGMTLDVTSASGQAHLYTALFIGRTYTVAMERLTPSNTQRAIGVGVAPAMGRFAASGTQQAVSPGLGFSLPPFNPFGTQRPVGYAVSASLGSQTASANVMELATALAHAVVNQTGTTALLSPTIALATEAAVQAITTSQLDVEARRAYTADLSAFASQTTMNPLTAAIAADVSAHIAAATQMAPSPAVVAAAANLLVDAAILGVSTSLAVSVAVQTIVAVQNAVSVFAGGTVVDLGVFACAITQMQPSIGIGYSCESLTAGGSAGRVVLIG